MFASVCSAKKAPGLPLVLEAQMARLEVSALSRSVTARDAQLRADALGCAGGPGRARRAGNGSRAQQ